MVSRRLRLDGLHERVGRRQVPLGNQPELRRELLAADARLLSHQLLGDDAVRDLDQWLPEVDPYRHDVGFRVSEPDDIDPNDIRARTLPPHALLAIDSLFVVERAQPNGSIRGSLHVDVDDGRYDVQVMVTTWDEQF